MILPNNGKVVIIDDKPSDVIDLIAALSKEKVPFVHYREEDLSDLPDSPIKNIRLIFLDLELVTDTYTSEKNITSPIKTRLMRVLEPRSPYALVIWSKQQGKYKEALLADFDGEFKDYRPIFHTSLPKSDILGHPEAIEKIKKELETEMVKFMSFNAFLVWESIVNESSGVLTNSITTLYKPDGDWDKKTKFLLYKLAEAYSGRAVKNLSDIKQLHNALYTLTLSFTDKIENSIDVLVDDKFKGLIDPAHQSIDNFTAVINKLLLVSQSSNDANQPGNIFLPLLELNDSFKKISDEMESSLIRVSKLPEEKSKDAIGAIKKKYQSDKQKIDERKSDQEADLNDIVVSALKEEEQKNEDLRTKVIQCSIAIQLVITPLCDYAQEKARVVRILPGAMILSGYRQHLNNRSAFTYVSDADFRYEDSDRLLIFDFRFLTSVRKKDLGGRPIGMRLKHQFLSDIQVKLSSHINRSGVLYIS